MMCPYCGSEIQEGKKFCGDCGAMVPPPPPPAPVESSRCSNCGAQNPFGKGFCGDCGSMMSLPPPVQQTHSVGTGVRYFPEKMSLRKIGRAAMMIGLALAIVSVILFVLTNAMEDEVSRLIWERNYDAANDAQDMARILEWVAWITMGLGIICMVGGAVAHLSSEA